MRRASFVFFNNDSKGRNRQTTHQKYLPCEEKKKFVIERCKRCVSRIRTLLPDHSTNAKGKEIMWLVNGDHQRSVQMTIKHPKIASCGA